MITPPPCTKQRPWDMSKQAKAVKSHCAVNLVAETAIDWLADQGRLGVVEQLLAAGVDVNGPTEAAAVPGTTSTLTRR